MSRKYLVFILLFGFHQFNPSAFAAQHALVVGINEYPQEGNINLKGAVNDARLIEKALRRIHVQLPKKRLLLTDVTHQPFVPNTALEFIPRRC